MPPRDFIDQHVFGRAIGAWRSDMREVAPESLLDVGERGACRERNRTSESMRIGEAAGEGVARARRVERGGIQFRQRTSEIRDDRAKVLVAARRDDLARG